MRAMLLCALAQVNHCQEWLQCLRATFEAMDVDKDGRLKPSEILAALKDKLPEAEVRQAGRLHGTVPGPPAGHLECQ